jgi:hypothetical protein
MIAHTKVYLWKKLNSVSRKLSLFVFGNSLGFRLNFNWKMFAKKAKFNYKLPIIESKEAINLVTTRLCVLGKSNCLDLRNFVHDYFESGNGQPVSGAPQIIVMDRESQKLTAGWVYEILKEFAAPVESFFQSYFAPYHIIIQKTIPGLTTADTSFGWHFDDNPKGYIKLFVYLNDVFESNGAFRAFDLSSSKKIIASGFKSYSAADRLKSQPIAEDFLKNNPSALKVLEGEAGTVLAFDNNLVHKGTAPREGFRYAIQIPIIPALNEFTRKEVEIALGSPRLRDYPANPAFNDHGY